MTNLPESFGTVVIGAGQAGLATSYLLALRGLHHVVLERSRVGEAWRRRWDSLCMVLPNWSNNLPGFPYQGAEPDGFQTRDEWVADLTRYAADFSLPVREGVAVLAVTTQPDGRFSLQTTAGTLVAQNVVVATGPYQLPRIPTISTGMADTIHQLHSGAYRNPEELAPGAVLVVGSGNSGSQIAEELNHAGRTVYLSVGSSGVPLRRYRGRDVYRWFLTANLAPVLLREGLPSRGFANITGNDGGRALDLRRFARDGIHLIGRLRAIDGGTITLLPDLATSLADIDRRTETFRRVVDAYVKANNLDAPIEELAEDEEQGDVDGVEAPTRLDLPASGITSVIWATGYAWDLSWLPAAVLDASGAPNNAEGFSPCPGLYFAGMSANHPISTAIGSVGAEAERIVAAIAGRG